MRRSTLLLTVLLLLASPALARAADGPAHRGWGWLVEKLVADGVDRGRVEAVFDDPRLEPFDGLDFGLAPREPRSLYRGFLKPASIAGARACRRRYANELDAAAARYGVPASVVAAIIHVESGCGQHTGNFVILHRLARLAMANEPENLSRNVARLASGDDLRAEAAVRNRAAYLEHTFYPEVRALFTLADRLGADPLSIRGSGSGAFGTPQFLPTSYLAHGTDADGDGRVDLYDPADAVLSCAGYLAGNGWRTGLSAAERRRVIWAYNRSDAYIDTVLALANAIERPVAARAAAEPARRTAKVRLAGTSRTETPRPRPRRS